MDADLTKKNIEKQLPDRKGRQQSTLYIYTYKKDV